MTRALAILLSSSVVACGASSDLGDRAGPRSRLDPSELEAWSTGGGDAREGPGEAPTGSAEPALGLAGGEALVEVWAISHSRLSPSGGPERSYCALYGFVASGPLEGRREVPCEQPLGLRPEVALRPIEEDRARELRRALSGATLNGEPPPLEGTAPTVFVRVETDRRRLEGRVPQVRWPAPYEAPSVRPSPPTSLEEFWEALMFPERFVPLDSDHD